MLKCLSLYPQIPLNDGGWHYICMTWASGSGEINVYIDGALGKTFTGVAKGQSIPGSGTVVLGQVRG